MSVPIRCEAAADLDAILHVRGGVGGAVRGRLAGAAAALGLLAGHGRGGSLGFTAMAALAGAGLGGLGGLKLTVS